jgi:hypothetical protein
MKTPWKVGAAAYLTLFMLLLDSQSNAQKVKYKEMNSTVPLSDVIAATESALNEYQSLAESPVGTKDGIH